MRAGPYCAGWAGGAAGGTTIVVLDFGGGGSLLLKLKQPASSSGRRMATADHRMNRMTLPFGTSIRSLVSAHWADRMLARGPHNETNEGGLWPQFDQSPRKSGNPGEIA